MLLLGFEPILSGLPAHSLDKLVDEILAVAMVTTLNEVPGLLSVATSGIAQFEQPEEVVGLFEVRAHCDYLVDEVLNTDDTKLAKSILIMLLSVRGVRLRSTLPKPLL